VFVGVVQVAASATVDHLFTGILPGVFVCVCVCVCVFVCLCEIEIERESVCDLETLTRGLAPIMDVSSQKKYCESQITI
jgi:hypothetical protein